MGCTERLQAAVCGLFLQQEHRRRHAEQEEGNAHHAVGGLPGAGFDQLCGERREQHAGQAPPGKRDAGCNAAFFHEPVRRQNHNRNRIHKAREKAAERRKDIKYHKAARKGKAEHCRGSKDRAADDRAPQRHTPEDPGDRRHHQHDGQVEHSARQRKRRAGDAERFGNGLKKGTEHPGEDAACGGKQHTAKHNDPAVEQPAPAGSLCFVHTPSRAASIAFRNSRTVRIRVSCWPWSFRMEVPRKTPSAPAARTLTASSGVRTPPPQ